MLFGQPKSLRTFPFPRGLGQWDELSQKRLLAIHRGDPLQVLSWQSVGLRWRHERYYGDGTQRRRLPGASHKRRHQDGRNGPGPSVDEYITSEFKHETGIDLGGDLKAIVRLKDAAEQVKIELSTLITTEINLPYVATDATGPKNLRMTLTRAKLEQLTRPIVERIRDPILKTLTDAKLTQAQIDKVILIGGQTKMPLVQQFVEDIVGKSLREASTRWSVSL